MPFWLKTCFNPIPIYERLTSTVTPILVAELENDLKVEEVVLVMDRLAIDDRIDI